MIVIGQDVHKHSVTAVAVDEAGRPARGDAEIPAGSQTSCSGGRRASTRTGTGRWETPGG